MWTSATGAEFVGRELSMSAKKA